MVLIYICSINATGGEIVTNMNLLKSKIVEKGMNIATVVEKVGIDKSTFYRKLANGGENFTVEEVYNIASTLELSASEVNAIFFDLKVA